MMDAFFPLIGSIAIGTLIAGIGYYFARKSGLTSVQAEYAATLAKTNDALNQRIDALEDSAKAARDKAAQAEARSRALAAKVGRLERTVAHLAEENDYLRERLKMPPRNVSLVEELINDAEATDGL